MNKTVLAGAACVGLIITIAGEAQAASICAAFHGSWTYPTCPYGGSPKINSNGVYGCKTSTGWHAVGDSITGVSHVNGGGAANDASGSFAKGDVVSFSWSNVKNSSGPLTAKFNDLNLPNGIVILSVPYTNITPKYTFSAASADYFTISMAYSGNANFKLNWSCSGP